MLKKLVTAAVLVAGHLLLDGLANRGPDGRPRGVANAQTSSASTSTPAVPASSATQKASDVLANARRLYSEEGACVALPEFENALALFRRQNDERAEAITLGLIGNCYKKFGNHARALEYLKQALVLKRKLGDSVEEGKTLSHLGLLHWGDGSVSRGH